MEAGLGMEVVSVASTGGNKQSGSDGDGVGAEMIVVTKGGDSAGWWFHR